MEIILVKRYNDIVSMKISIIVPTYNGRELLQKYILPLEKEFQSSPVNEVLIVDNNSNDDTSDLFNSSSAFFKYLKLQKNEGFTGAVNKGAEEATGDYLLILNNDCEITNLSLNSLIEFLNHNEKCVATQPIVMRSNLSIENIGYIVDLKKGKAKVVTKEEDIPEPVGSFKVWSKGYIYGLSAACLLINKSVFMEIGKLDESFHSYLEDVDLFLRLSKDGYHFSPCIDATVVHAHMSTSSKMRKYKEWHDFTNWIRIISKNYPIWFTLLHFPTLFMERLRNLSGYIKS